MLVLIATLTVRREAESAFRDYEAAAARIMSRHGGNIERAIEIDGEESAGTFREVHIVTFPDRAAFDAYRADPEIVALATLRKSALASTEILFGRDGLTY